MQPDADAQNAYLEKHTWEEYAAWHLGLRDGAADETKARYAFVMRGPAPHPPQWADRLRLPGREWRHKEVELAAHDLLQELDARAGIDVTTLSASCILMSRQTMMWR